MRWMPGAAGAIQRMCEYRVIRLVVCCLVSIGKAHVACAGDSSE